MGKKRVNMEEYYSGLHSMPLPVFSKHLKHNTKCRVCMQGGDTPISNINNPSDIKEALSIFGNIEINDDEKNSTCLCYVCYKFLKSAILFKKVAQRSNEILKQPILKQSPIHDKDYDRVDTFDKSDKSNLVSSNKETKEECKTKQKKPRPKRCGNKVQCAICKKLLGKSYYYNIHLKLHNPNLPDQFVCDICGKSFKLKKVYLGHMERHETRYIFKCNLCPFAGRYKERLSMHMRVHTGELKFACTQCPAKYISRGRLNDHVRLKHTEPQFKCDSCDKAYHSNLTLQRHVEAAHLKIKRHQCDDCGMAFGYRHDMLKHQRHVHKRASLRPRYNKSAYQRISNKLE